MKLNMDLVRDILLQIEEKDDGLGRDVDIDIAYSTFQTLSGHLHDSDDAITHYVWVRASFPALKLRTQSLNP